MREREASKCPVQGVTAAQAVAPFSTSTLQQLHQVIDVSLAIEQREVVDLFAGADEAGGKAELILNGYDNAAFAAAVEFGDNEAGQADGLLEFARLRERVAAGCRIDHQERFVRRSRILLGQRPFHFLQLGHKIRFGMLTAGRVANQEIGFSFRRRLIGLVAERGRIGMVLGSDHFQAKTFRPNSKLFDRSGAECIGSSENDSMSMLLKIVRQFRGRCCFAGPVHAYDQDHGWLVIHSMNGRRFFEKDLPDFLPRDFNDIADPEQ